MKDVKKSQIYSAFCFKISFVAIYAVFAKSVLLQFTHFCVEKNCISGEKMTNMRYSIELVAQCQ